MLVPTDARRRSEVSCGAETKATTRERSAISRASARKTSERVVVTATRAPVAIEEAGVAASVFTARDFDPTRGAFVQNLLRDVPGLSVVQNGKNGGITSMFARGGDRTRPWCCWMAFR